MKSLRQIEKGKFFRNNFFFFAFFSPFMQLFTIRYFTYTYKSDVSIADISLTVVFHLQFCFFVIFLFRD